MWVEIRLPPSPDLCARHDDLIFADIEKNELDLSNQQHLFLLAYRAAFRELHATMEGAAKLQGGYVERLKRGLDSENSPSPAGLIAVRFMVMSWETYCYKAILDRAYAMSNFDTINHDVIELGVDRPTVAACTLFSVDSIRVRDDVLRIHLNVWPIWSSRTAVVFSYLRSDALHARAFLDRILRADGFRQGQEISRLILNSCENFVLSPEHFDTWPDSKKEAVEAYIVHTLLKDDLAYDSSYIYLF